MRFFNFYLIIFIALIFTLNAEHSSQQLSYSRILLPAAENLAIDLEYNYPPSGFSKTYPIWGYSILLIPGTIIGSPSLFILVLQALMTFIGIKFIIKTFRLKSNLPTLLLMLPYVAAMSVKWPDAIVLFLITAFLYYGREALVRGGFINYILAIIALGITLNFRGEYLVFLPILILLYILILKKSKALWFLLAYVLILPWGIRNYIVTSEFLLSSTNAGAVSYISLGQLPNNEWGIEPYDPTAYRIAKKEGFPSPYSTDANKYFRAEFFDHILENPLEFFKKVSYNVINVFWGGVYTGEYANLFIEDDRLEVDATVNDANGLEKFEALMVFGGDVFAYILLEKSINVIFRIIFLILIISMLFKLGKIRENDKILMVICLSVIIHKILIIGFIQYEPRHINLIYPFIFGLSFYRKP